MNSFTTHANKIFSRSSPMEQFRLKLALDYGRFIDVNKPPYRRKVVKTPPGKKPYIPTKLRFCFTARVPRWRSELASSLDGVYWR